MAGASFKMDLGPFKSGLGKALAHFADRQELAANLGEAMVAATRLRFREEQGPDGKPWPKSRRAQEEGGQTLSDKGLLKGSINYEATPDLVAWGTNDERAATHQVGAEIHPKRAKMLVFPGVGGQPVFAKKVTIPARPFLGANEDDLEEARAVMAAFVRAGFK